MIRGKPTNNTSNHKQSKLLIVKKDPVKSQERCKLRVLEHDEPYEPLLATTYDRLDCLLATTRPNEKPQQDTVAAIMYTMVRGSENLPETALPRLN